MTLLVAAIEHHARKLAQSVTRAVAEKCSGFSDYEAGDHLTDPGETVWFHDRVIAESKEEARQRLVDAEAEQELWTPPGGESPLVFDISGGLPNYISVQPPEASAADLERHRSRVSEIYEALHMLTQTPAAGQRGENPAGVTPPTPAGSPDPSPTIDQTARQPSVRGEGSPLDSAIPPAPRGEHPTPGEFAAVAVREVLADHAFIPDPLVRQTFAFDTNGACACDPASGCWESDWRDHVAEEIQRRIDAATNAAPK